MRGRRVLSSAISIFCLLALTQNIHPEGTGLLPSDESPDSFYEASLDSEDVRLFLSGSWKINLSASGGFGWSEASGFSTDLYYSGITQGIAFSQSPDLTISLLILNNFFFDSSFTDNFDESTFRLGYIGNEDDFIQSVTLGNMDISLSGKERDSDYFNVPGGGPSSFGLHSTLRGPSSEHELLFRIDPHEELKKVYIGDDLVIETVLEVSEYLRGRLFLIPGPPAEVTVYTESDPGSGTDLQGDGRYYEVLDQSLYSYSPQSGRLILDETPEGAVVIETPDSSLFKIYDPGIFLGYESAAAYAPDTAIPDESWRTRVFLAESVETASAGIEIKKEILSDEGIIILKQAAGGSEPYPLYGLLSSPGKVYGALSLTEAGVSEKKLVFRVRESSGGYTIDDPVEGSINITVNGISNYSWSLSGGTISFDNPPGDQDRVVITYRKKNSGLGTDILLASANRFSITSDWEAEINAGGRWNLADGYSVPGEETTSYAEAAAGLYYSNDSESENDSPLSISAGISIGSRLYTGNSSGRLLLKDMSAVSFDVGLNRNRVFPSSLSQRLRDDSDPGLYLNPEDRGILFYKDYRISNGFSGYYLQDYNISDLPDEKIFSPVDSPADARFKAGPYTAAALSDGKSGEILAMDYILPAGNGWNGVQIPLSDGGSYPDLSTSSAFSFDCKAEGDLTGIELYVEIGSVSEDLDGDGLLDAESSEYSTGFVFNDPNSAAGTLVGGDNLTGENGLKDSEDFNGNGFLDTEKNTAIVFQKLASNPTGDWARYRIYLTETAGDTAKSRLRNAGFIRITAINTSASEKSGRILFDGFRFEGSPMTPVDDVDFVPPSFTQTYEGMLPASETASAALDSPTIEAGSTNQLLRINWDSGDWKLYSYTSAENTSAYGNMVFYYYCPAVTAYGAEQPMLHFGLVDSTGRGKKGAVPLSATNSWHRAELRRDAVYIDGELSSGSTFTDDSGDERLYKIEVYTSGTASGALITDEFYLADPDLNMSAGITADFSLEYSDNILEAGDLPLIGPLRMKQTASAETFSDNLASSETGFFEGFIDGGLSLTTNISTEIIGAPISADLIIGNTFPLVLAAGHELKIPLSFAGLSIFDTFFSSELSAGNFTKSNSVSISTPVISGVIFGFSTSEENGQLLRRWNSALDLSLDSFRLGFNADFLLSDLNHAFYSAGYFPKWYEATLLLGSQAAVDLGNRSVDIGLSPALTAGPVGIELQTAFSSDIIADGESGSKIVFDLGIPVVFGEDPAAVRTELGYTREGTFSVDGDSPDFFSDISSGLSLLSARDYLYNSVPYYELFDPDLGGRLFEDCTINGINSAVLGNSAVFSLSRNYTSSILDLLIPYSLVLQLDRVIRKDFSDLEDSRELDITWRSAALNLFGSAGVYPVFDFYFSDELNWTVEAIINDPFSEDSSSDLLFKAGGSVFGHLEDIFSVDGTILLPINTDTEGYSEAELTYVWNVYPEIKADLPVFTDEDEAFQMFVNEEKLTLNFTDTFSAELRHSTSFVMPGRFTLSAFILTGFEYNAVSDNPAALFGCSLGLSGSVIY